MRIPSFELDLELLQIWQGRGWLEFWLKKWNEKWRVELEPAEVSREMESMLTWLEEMGVDLWKVRIGERSDGCWTLRVKGEWLRSFPLPLETALLWAVTYPVESWVLWQSSFKEILKRWGRRINCVEKFVNSLGSVGRCGSICFVHLPCVSSQKSGFCSPCFVHYPQNVRALRLQKWNTVVPFIS